MISDRLRQWTRWIVEPMARALHRTGITPNQLTFLGFALNLVNVWLLATGRLRLAGALILAFTALDAFDGSLARLTGQVTRFGAFLDSVLDRFAEAGLFFGLLLYFSHDGAKDATYVDLTFLSLTGSFMVSYTRARAEGLGLTCKAGWFTRVERIVLLSAGLLVGWVRPVLWILAVLTNFTAIQRMAHVYRSTRADDAGSAAGRAR